MIDRFQTKAMTELARKVWVIREHGSLEAYEKYLHDLGDEYGFPTRPERFDADGMPLPIVAGGDQ